MPEGVRLAPASLTVSKNEMLCLALNDYWEARGESLRGRVAVAQVVLNRVKDPRFPNSICEVVSQNNSNGKACQFSWYCDGRSDVPTDKRAWRSSVLLAMSVLRRDSTVMDPTHGALWFHTKAVNPPWSRQMDRTGRIDNHIFYTDNRARQAPVLQTATRDLAGGSLVADLFADAGVKSSPAARQGLTGSK
ncbi:cell wall hydrolase [Phaeovibrio sulfidiphilus]|uniref:Cell wall hydrolase n=2 Tax=Phaeovibrio sulfidiphilus TaxID=1220600 RepID=A0A8J6YR98_9PROT|nr:cell wall hydrolase [Phaeovibrio sulfidiphilus]